MTVSVNKQSAIRHNRINFRPANAQEIDYPTLVNAAQRLTAQEITITLRHRVMPISWHPEGATYVYADQAGLQYAEKMHYQIGGMCQPRDLLNALNWVYGGNIVDNASHWLARQQPKFSAQSRFSRNQIIILIISLALLALGVDYFGEITRAGIWLALSAIFVSVVILRLASLLDFSHAHGLKLAQLTPDELPVYTVLVPLFRETAVVRQLIDALTRLDYPVDKLDIKLILEADDHHTRAFIEPLTLPRQFEVIVVPHTHPRTKPKALNHALAFARGQLVTIFDAEDIPEPWQLKLTARSFAASDSDIVCLQCRLAYYNANENWLTRQFAIEYAALFDMILPMLARLNLPLPLGGTSNHFRIEALRKLGGWDPYNVTEDADLGIRLARFGWRAAVIPATTFEEATCQLGNWMQQRARWLKGWLQTWLVHLRHPIEAWRSLGAWGFIVTQVLMAGILISALFHPFILSYTLWIFTTQGLIPHSASLWDTFNAALSLVVLLSGYGVTMLAGWIALGKRGLRALRLSVLTMPFYWMLISIAAWLAIWQFLTQPTKWNKTQHGVSQLGKQ